MWDVMVTGSNGLLGGFLIPVLRSKGYRILATGKGPCRLPESWFDEQVIYMPLDITDGMSVMTFMNEHKPRRIIHAAAMTQADDCERDPVGCWNVNVTATRFLIDAAKTTGASMLYVSTDFVFDGDGGPYKETDQPAPVNFYGSSKLAAERAVMASGLDWSIVRTVLVYGRSDHQARSNIMTWVRDKLTTRTPINVVDDQLRTPTWAGDLALGISLVAEHNAGGIWHISGADLLTPYEMAVKTANYLNLDISLMTRVTAESFSQPARRPLKTGFMIDKAQRELGYTPVSFEKGLELTLGNN
jgi:dTDP-4-dehydrorhamnose reductase